MNDRNVMKDWVLDALKATGGRARIVDVCKHIWQHHESELRAGGDLFYTWQYEVRWAAQMLRDAGELAPVTSSDRGWWSVATEVRA